MRPDVIHRKKFAPKWFQFSRIVRFFEYEFNLYRFSNRKKFDWRKNNSLIYLFWICEWIRKFLIENEGERSVYDLSLQ